MSEHLRQKKEKIEKLLEWLAQEAAEGTPIVVEGKKDIEALRELGVTGKMLTAKMGQKSLLDLVSEIEEHQPREVILLLDFDRGGKGIAKRLRQILEKEGATPNTTFWRELLSLVGRDVKDIEGLPAYIETLKRKIGEP